MDPCDLGQGKFSICDVVDLETIYYQLFGSRHIQDGMKALYIRWMTLFPTLFEEVYTNGLNAIKLQQG